MDQETQQTIATHNAGYLDKNAINMRLETVELIESIKAFLNGNIMVTKQVGDEIKLVRVETGDKEKCNATGAAHIVNYVSSIINPSVVQGNYTDEWYRENIETIHKRLAYMLIVNKHEWRIRNDSMHSIIGFIMELVKPFLSRLIDNEERKSYAATIRSSESSTISNKNPAVVGHFR